jgi:DNA-binding response OmpR family regulator
VVGGRRVDLTRLEFELLDYLYQRQRKVVDRSDLLRDVWGYTHVWQQRDRHGRALAAEEAG